MAALDEALSGALVLAQECLWPDVDVAGRMVLDGEAVENQSDCRCMTPSKLAQIIKFQDTGDCWSSFQINRVLAINVHLPHAGRPLDDFLVGIQQVDALIRNRAVDRLKTWKEIIIAGDFNVTLPGREEGFTGEWVYPDPGKTTRNKRRRVQETLEFMVRWGLRALNTYPSTRGWEDGAQK